MRRSVRRAGDRAILVECTSWREALRLTRELLRQPFRGQEEVIQGEVSVLVAFADDQSAREARSRLREQTTTELAPEPVREVRVDVVYDGPDLDTVGELTGLGRDGVARLHAQTSWTVAFAGFAPGFAYLMAPHDQLRVARRTEPRTRVPAGSVALGGTYSAVYPRESPGGWHLIGRSPTVMWDVNNDPPATLQPGDQVRFTPVRDAVSLTAAPAYAASPSDAGDAAAAEGPALMIEKPGFHATIQDAGRRGFGHLGVGRSGALDAESLAEANWLVGNPSGAAGIEIAPGGFECRAVGDLVVAVTGASVPLAIGEIGSGDDEHPAPFHTPFMLRDGERLTFGVPRAGFRSYLAVRGGVAVAPVLGSRSTDTLSSLGPLPLRGGVVIPVGAEEISEVWYRDEFPAEPAKAHAVALPMTLGPRDDLFSPAAVDQFLGSTWTVATAADRVGLRLSSSSGSLPMEAVAELPSEGMATGSIQVPPSGNPILFLNDHPVTGGYPVIGVVQTVALRFAAQLAPGARVVFELAGTADAGRGWEVASA
ncbi:MAG: carboxyltransferase protein [Actinomycetia bacterium]|nr:carboxyltransferase protein [Actinomycetes bacterium]